jgi:hypothetical protein
MPIDPVKAEQLEGFIRRWAEFSDNNPQIVLGDWLHTFSIMMGLAMRLSDMNEEALDDACYRIEKMVRSSFDNSRDHIKPSSLQ